MLCDEQHLPSMSVITGLTAHSSRHRNRSGQTEDGLKFAAMNGLCMSHVCRL